MDPWPPWPSHCTSSHPSWLHLMATLSTAYRAVHAQQLPDSFGAALALTPFASLTGISFVNPYNTTCACACAYTCVNPHLGWLSPSNGTQEGCSTYSGHVTEFVRTNSVRVPNMCCSSSCCSQWVRHFPEAKPQIYLTCLTWTLRWSLAPGRRVPRRHTQRWWWCLG